MRSRILAIVIAVVVPLVALGVVISRGGGSAHKPARLPISAPGGNGGSATLGVAQADAALYPYGGIVYKAGADVPKLDGSARAYKVSRGGTQEQLDRLNAALVGGADPSSVAFFRADDGSSWSFDRQTSDGVVTSSGTAVACPPNADCPAPDTTVPQHPENLPSQDEARKIALELLQQAGIDTMNATVSVDDFVSVWSVRVDPMVDGIPTEGFGSTVAIGPDGVVEYANGTLGRPQAADEYPLIGTSAAIDHLNKGEGFVGPRPMLAETATASDTTSAGPSGSAGSAPGSVGGAEPAPPLPPCDGTGAPTTFPCGSPDPMPPVTDTTPPPPPQQITIAGAERILIFASTYDGSDSWLVPAYRFTTGDGVGPSVLAIDDSFFAPPPDQTPSGKGSVDSGGSVTIAPAPASDPAAKEPSTGG